MKCHYEILELPREATDSEIKTAYRKLALKWHPDKNLDNPDLAKEQFQIIQQAYEVLIDKHERAWYDAHRDQILRGANSGFEDKSLDVFQYFTTTCFKGYGDDEKGFYMVYGKVFEQIVQEDIEHMDDKEELTEIPGFGNSQSGYEEVKAFYDYWMSYSTKKSYSWLESYDIREGKGDRRLLKIIEKENKKIRQKAKKERNEEIRNLVAFVRKRDKRVQIFKKEMEAKALENRKKQEQLSKQKRLERQQLNESTQQADWLKFDNVKSELEVIEKELAAHFGEELSGSEQDEEDDLNNLYCVACNKIFKTPKAFENHESSKKHKENVEKLVEEMIDDENDIANDCDSIEEENEDLEEEEVVNGSVTNNDSDSLNSENEDEPLKKSMKKKKKRNIVVHEEESVEQVHESVEFTKVSDDDDFDFGTSKSQKKKSKRSNKIKQTVEPKPTGEELKPIEQPIDKATIKKQARKEKKANKKDIIKPKDLEDIDLSHCCVTCKAEFPSKNKLFEHLKKTGHGVYLDQKNVKINRKKN
ncbi:dnaJ homolog subfamily C member 21 [Anthonomus grandis grandis]|uniref:dnaJ homolog subfamily C member 21 n=1 Tax=Anthonomus grandis grandis TaxID=2921223 RepID=UPI0021659B4D|nr:dnaJ homolog subfamily C member 21 [Anthonomus grandis grandis]